MILWSHKLNEKTIEETQGSDIFCMPNTISFTTLDGTLKFIMTVINYELSMGVNRETRLILNKINRYLSKLMLVHTRYDESTDYADYCKQVSNVLKVPTDYKEIKSNKGSFSKMFKNPPEKPIIFIFRDSVYYGSRREVNEIEDFKLFVEDALLKQVQAFKVPLDCIPGTLMSEYGCHVEILVSLRFLISAFLRLCNSRDKYSENGLMFYDSFEINQRIEMCEMTLKRIKNLAENKGY